MNKKRYRSLLCLGSLLVLSALFPVAVFSQSLEQKVKELEKKVAQLEQRVARLEEMVLQLQKSPARPAAAAADRWKDKANWRLLRKGMSKSDVERILGTPPTVVPNVHYGDIWFYPDSHGGNASFDTNNILTSWSEI